MNLYQEEILEHFRHPRNKGRLVQASYSAAVVNPSCGDSLGLDINVKDGVVTEIGFWGDGCAISQAAMSLVGEEIKGQKLERIQSMSEDDILDMLGVPIGPNRKKCGLLSLEVLRKVYEESQKSEN